MDSLITIDIPSSIQKVGSEDICKKLFAILKHTLPKDQDILCRAIESQNTDAIRSIIHKLQGGLAYCILPKYTAMLVEIRSFILEDNYTAATKLMPDLIQESKILSQKILEYCGHD